ncbi:hypothetical protein EJ03DRAFT_41694 [Teratosphaeria nubilosa]|uniref:Uncharacterized protein n=1 Tax=Teratosphaeria nubilosa TaxID=161662 RepID=A0A6G1KVL4_9PEZI|nr:hypothetical protein EJ03DRAFT_41694 [Teratosphaeria nubilosa]
MHSSISGNKRNHSCSFLLFQNIRCLLERQPQSSSLEMGGCEMNACQCSARSSRRRQRGAETPALELRRWLTPPTSRSPGRAACLPNAGISVRLSGFSSWPSIITATAASIIKVSAGASVPYLHLSNLYSALLHTRWMKPPTITPTPSFCSRCFHLVHATSHVLHRFHLLRRWRKADFF